jgi:hypothetical protein
MIMNTQSNKPIPSEKNPRTILYILGVSVLVILLAWWAYSMYAPSPAKTVKAYFNHIAQEQYEEAFDLLAGNYQKSKKDVETFQAQFENSRNHGTVYLGVKIEKITPTERKTQKVVAFTLLTREKGRDTQPHGQYVLTKLDGVWKITDSLN